MKLKDWILWLCVVALLVTEMVLFSANRQKAAMGVQLREAQEQAAQLQSALDQLKSSSVAALKSENARLRAENQALTQKFPQLQTENRTLHEQNQKLNQQLESVRNTEQQQQQQLQQIQAESQQAASAPDAAADPTAAATQANACINNLRQIDAAKQQWALENNKPETAVPTAQDLMPYLADGVFPVCPSGGTYTINAVGVPPTCSVPGHALSQ